MAHPNQAQAGAETGSSTETPQGGQADSLNNPGKEQSLDERLDGAKSPADVLKLIDDAKAGRIGNADAVEKSPDGATETNAAAEGGEQTQQTEEQSKGENGAPAETPEGGAEEKAEGGEGQGGEPAAGEQTEKTDGEGKADGEGAEEKLPDRIRLSNFSKVEKLALTIKRENPSLTLAQAEAKAKDALGIKDEPPAKQESNDPGLPKTLEEADAKIKDLVAKRTKAFKEDLDFAEGDRLTNEIEALREHKFTLRERASQRATEEERAYNAAFDAAETKASALYDFVKQTDSAAFKRMAEIDRQLEENKDPLFSDPNKPLLIAQMVAKELAIAPKSATAKAAAPKPATTAAPKPPVTTTTQPKKQVPPVASGTSRTSTSTTQGGDLSKRIDGLRTPQDIENFVNNLGR